MPFLQNYGIAVQKNKITSKGEFFHLIFSIAGVYLQDVFLLKIIQKK